MSGSHEPRSRQRRSRALIAACLALGIVAGGATHQIASAHDVNMALTYVAQGVNYRCVMAEAEIDHDTARHNRTYHNMHSHEWKQGATSGTWTCYNKSYYNRMRGQAYRKPVGGTYTECWSTIGDGLGDYGYTHKTDGQWSYNTAWSNSWPCGATSGYMVTKTSAHTQNGGWVGGSITSPSHALS